MEVRVAFWDKWFAKDECAQCGDTEREQFKYEGVWLCDACVDQVNAERKAALEAIEERRRQQALIDEAQDPTSLPSDRIDYTEET